MIATAPTFRPPRTPKHLLQAAVSCQQVTKEFGARDTKTLALRGVDLDVYDGQLTFVRLRWNSGFGRGGFGAAWNHDLPRAEQHLAMIVRELSLVDMRTDGSTSTMLYVKTAGDGLATGWTAK